MDPFFRVGLLVLVGSAGSGWAAPPSPMTKALTPRVAETLSRRERPNEHGAMGRNRGGYIHARFQCYLHRHVDHAIATESAEPLRWFCEAAEYALQRQQPNGGFDFRLPPGTSAQASPSETDLASGTAFFTASLATGLLELKRSRWFRETDSLVPERLRVMAIQSQLSRSVQHVFQQRKLLRRADGAAPNRLLLDALALMAGGALVDRDEVLAAGREFLDRALKLVHDDGFFIEGGGYDSSYNGVATAIAYRIERLFPSDRLAGIADRAMAWQMTRIEHSGQIMTDGNARVHQEGEHFLGRRKDVDVAFTLEAMALAYARKKDPQVLDLAQRVQRFYSRH